MSSITVLKFGGSVLATDADAARATHEVYRWVRRGHRVVAVVSALSGVTDALLERAAAGSEAQAGVSDASARATASLVATGEQQTAALLALALDRAGVPAEVLDPGAIALVTTGPALDATPVSLSTQSVLDALERAPVLVVPGFTGRDERGRTTLLGRGGSDLSALFIAQQLRDTLGADDGTVRCRLIKDVDGLYTHDPALPGPSPRRFASLAWDDALALDGSIVQHKGVRLARAHRLEFEVGGLLGARATLVGDLPCAFDDAPRIPGRAWRVRLLGAGTVGGGVVESIRALPAWFTIDGVLCRDPAKAGRLAIDPSLILTDPTEALAGRPDVVVEALGGLDPARTLIERALDAGVPVVSANKAVIADSGTSLVSGVSGRASDSQPAIRFSAAVGGAVPMLEATRRARRRAPIMAIEGVLNGTSNVVLTQVAHGRTFEEALAHAQRAGFAEADPSRDLDGRDAADKLSLLIGEAFGVTLDPAAIPRVPLRASAIPPCPPRPGLVLKQLARARRDATGAIVASVSPAWVEARSPIGRATDQENALVITTADGRSHAVWGKGAGRAPTALAIVADLIDLAHESLDQPLAPSGIIEPAPARREAAGVLDREVIGAR